MVGHLVHTNSDERECVIEVTDNLSNVHVVLLGDSTLDNGRYLNVSFGELSVEKQVWKRCLESGWGFTMLAQDGAMIDDVLVRQLPYIPDDATHLVLSISGNDLLSLLNQIMLANFTMSSVYAAVTDGLKQVYEHYSHLLRALSNWGCHLACCTVYQPNFNHFFIKSLVMVSLRLHNSRIKQISTDLDCSVIDLANMFDCCEDFTNPLELSTRGGAKFVENIAAFINDHPTISLQRYRRALPGHGDADSYSPAESVLGIPMGCCATKTRWQKVYASKTVPEEESEQVDSKYAGEILGKPLPFSEAQQHWRDG